MTIIKRKKKRLSAKNTAAYWKPTAKVPALSDPRQIEDYVSLETKQILKRLDISIDCRKKLELQAKLERIHERIGVALQHAGINASMNMTSSEIQIAVDTVNKPPTFDTKEKRKRLAYQQGMLQKITGFLNSCYERKIIITDVSQWLSLTLDNLEDLPSIEDLDKEEDELKVMQESTHEALAIAKNAGEQLKKIGFKLLKDAGYIDQDAKTEKVPVARPVTVKAKGKASDKVIIFDEDALLKDATNWTTASMEIKRVLQESIRAVHTNQAKTSVRNASKQFKFIVLAMEKRQEQLKAKDDENIQLQFKIKQLSSTIEKLKTQNTNLQVKIDTLTVTVEDLEKEQKSSQSLIEELRLEIGFLENQFAELVEEQNASLAVSKKKSSVVRFTSSQRLCTRISHQLLVSPSTHTTLEKELTEYKDQMLLQEKTINDLEKKLKKEQEKVKKLEAKLAATETKAKEGVSFEKQVMGEMKFKMTSIHDEKDSLAQQVTKLKAELASKDELIDFQERRLRETKEDLNVWTAMMDAREPRDGAFGTSSIKEIDKVAVGGLTTEVKKIVERLKREYQLEINRLMDHIEKDKHRSEAIVRRLEQTQKETLTGIHKQSIHLLRAINRFKDSVARILEREYLIVAASDVSRIPNLMTDEVPGDAKTLLSQMAGNAVEMLVSIEFKLSQSLMNKSLEIKDNIIAKSFADRDLESQLAVTHKARMKVEIMHEKLRKVQDALAASENALKEIRKQKDSRYSNLMNRYNILRGQHNALQKEMQTIQDKCVESLKHKDIAVNTMVLQKTELTRTVDEQLSMLTSLAKQMKRKQLESRSEFQFQLRNQMENMATLKSTLKDKLIPKNLYKMCAEVIKQTKDLPAIRFVHLVHRYTAYRSLQAVRDQLQQQVDNAMPVERKKELVSYLKQIDEKRDETLREHQENMWTLDLERRRLFEQMGVMFKEVVAHSRNSNIQPLVVGKSKAAKTTPKSTNVQGLVYSEKAPFHLPPVSMQSRLLGTGIGTTAQEESYWKLPSNNPGMVTNVQVPHLLDLDVNQRMRAAKRTLLRCAFPTAKCEAYDYEAQKVKSLCSAMKPSSSLTDVQHTSSSYLGTSEESCANSV